jgi:hypothetical protein
MEIIAISRKTIDGIDNDRSKCAFVPTAIGEETQKLWAVGCFGRLSFFGKYSIHDVAVLLAILGT